MKKYNSNKAEVCYKDVCAKFYDENATIITITIASLLIMAGLSVVSKGSK